MIDWKEACRYFRREMRNGIAYHRRIASAEHAQRVILVNAMSELLPRIGLSRDGDFCLGCSSYIDGANEHQDWCPYVAALAAVTVAGRSVDLRETDRCPHGHPGCCGHHDLEDMPIHAIGVCR